MTGVRGGEASGAEAWGIFGAVSPARQEEASPQNQARPCPKPHPRCALACLGWLFLSRRDKKAREFVEE